MHSIALGHWVTTVTNHAMLDRELKGFKMFTHESDDAVERYSFGDIKVAFAYDMDAHDPVSDHDYLFCGIQRMENHSHPSDGGGWLHEYETLAEEMAELEGGDDSWSVRDVEEVREEVAEYAYFELRAFGEYGWPTFCIAIHKSTATRVTGYDGEDWERFAQGIVDAYAQWAEGRVYVVGVEDSATGAIEYVGNVYDEPTDSLARECAAYLGFEVAA